MKFQKLYFHSPTSVDSPVGGGAVGRLDSPHASAEIEGEESEVVCIDTPTNPECNLLGLLHEVASLPVQHLEFKGKNLAFNEIFMSVDEEDNSEYIPQHVRDLYVEYQRTNADAPIEVATGSVDKKKSDGAVEKYEKGIPIHGDEMYHNYISVIKKNPSQILRWIYVVDFIVSVELTF